jgi:hypothetical protein
VTNLNSSGYQFVFDFTDLIREAGPPEEIGSPTLYGSSSRLCECEQRATRRRDEEMCVGEYWPSEDRVALAIVVITSRSTNRGIDRVLFLN